MKHRLDFRRNRRIDIVLYITSETQQRDIGDARVYIDRKLGEGKLAEKPGEPTSDTSPTASSAACGTTNTADHTPLTTRLTRERRTAPR
jgi:hypothetical protein